MSATNWAECPRCKKKANDERRTALALLHLDYGQIAEELWLDRYVELQKPLTFQATLREDYNNVGVDENGVFQIHYIASCQACPYSFEYAHKETTDLRLP